MKELFENLQERGQEMLAPMVRVNELILNNLSELVDLNAKALSAYADLGVGQARAALDVKDADSLSGFTKQQAEMLESIQSQFKSDIERMTELATRFGHDFAEAVKGEPAASEEKASPNKSASNKS